MNIDRNSARALALSDRAAPQVGLADTLCGYEVEEIDIHDLARFLPQMNLEATSALGVYPQDIESE